MRTGTKVGVPASSSADGLGAEPRAHGGGPELVGSRVREERLRQKIGLRELARRVGVSASLVSQVELGKASPSVGTLYAIVNELGLSLDELFFQTRGRADGESAGTDGERARADGDETATVDGETVRIGGESAGTGPHPRQHVARGPDGRRAPRGDAELIRLPTKIPPVVYQGQARAIHLASGVRWKRLSPETPQDVDFLEVTYDVGSESCPSDGLMRHSGHEYGHILEGCMGVTVGFDTYELSPGDSISFDSTMPHRLFTVGERATRAIWVVVGRRGDPRLTRS